MGAGVDGANMREEELEVALKVVIVGDGGVGKSSMIQRYCRGTFTRDYKKTIGVDFLERQIEWVDFFFLSTNRDEHKTGEREFEHESLTS